MFKFNTFLKLLKTTIAIISGTHWTDFLQIILSIRLDNIF
jgi:hypothetical protein